MKQAEKSRKSRDHILATAFREFAELGYAGASINSICADGHIAKGLLYHYYCDRDALYLECVRRCFDELTGYMRAALDGCELTPELYFRVRLRFFRENPHHRRLFCEAVNSPAAPLCDELCRLRADFDAFNAGILERMLAGTELAPGLSLSDAVTQLRLFTDFLNANIRLSGGALPPEEHERLCLQALHTMLYGIVARR